MKTIITSIFAMAVLLLTSSAYALLVSPLPKVEIPKGEKAATLRITDDDHTWQAYVYRVEQSEDGKETLIESEDIILYILPSLRLPEALNWFLIVLLTVLQRATTGL